MYRAPSSQSTLPSRAKSMARPARTLSKSSVVASPRTRGLKMVKAVLKRARTKTIIIDPR